MTSASWELQKWIVGRLGADAALKAAMGITSGNATVLDHVPENQPMPYVEYEDGNGLEWDAGKTDGAMEYGTEHTVSLFTWSSYEGKKQAKAMNDAIIRNLRDAEAEATLDGHRVVNLRAQFSYVLRDGEEQAYYGVVGIRAVTEEV